MNAYRQTKPAAVKAGKRKTKMLFLHGIGSSSYTFRQSLNLLEAEGVDAIAPDWLGHGSSSMPASFDGTEASYHQALASFIASLGLDKQPYALVVHGFVLAQYALTYALNNQEQVERIMILNTPVARNSKLRPELAAYKNPLPFLRPAAGKPFDAMNYNAAGSPYAMDYYDAVVFAAPYEQSPVASQIIASTMDKVDFNSLLNKVDEGYTSWRKPAALCFGSSDPFLETGCVFQFLDSKRTNMKAMTMTGKVGHSPQEDYPELLHQNLMLFLDGTPEEWTKSVNKKYKISKTGVEEM